MLTDGKPVPRMSYAASSATPPADRRSCSDRTTRFGRPHPPAPERSSPACGEARVGHRASVARPALADRRRRAIAHQLVGLPSSYSQALKKWSGPAPDSLGERGELGGRDVAAAVFAVPGAQQVERTCGRRSSGAAPAASSRRGRRPAWRTGTRGRAGRPGRGMPEVLALGRPPASRTARRTSTCALSPPLLLVQIHSDQVAKPSLSHMSGHTASVTASPNHWCASSWTTVEALGDERVVDARLGLERVADVGRAVHDPAHALERIRPVQAS